MIALAISVCWILIGIAILCGIGYVVLWVLGQLGIVVPPMAVKIALIVFALLILIWFLGLLAGGGGLNFPAAFGTHRISDMSTIIQTLPLRIAA
jgi:hypothetical protein